MLNLLLNALGSLAPRLDSMTKYLNLLGQYDKKTILTKDQNLTIGFKIKGLSYIAMSAEIESALHTDRFSFLIRMKTGLECAVFLKKEKGYLKREKRLKAKNPYAREISEVWEKDFNLLDIEYYFLVSTKKEDLLDKVDKRLEKTNDDLEFKLKKLQNFSQELKNYLKDYEIEELNANELLSFYASLLNGEKQTLECDRYFFDDSFNNADICFYNNHFTRTLPDKTIYSSFVSIKTYESPLITRRNLSNLLQIDSNLILCLGFSPIGLKASERALVSARGKTKDLETIEEFDRLKEAVETEKNKLYELSINILINESSQENLERAVSNLVALCKRNNLLPTRETIAQKSVFLSLFPSMWEKCNPRKRIQTSSVLTSFLSFENEKTGQDFNPWGEGAVAVLRNSLGKPYLFNFHLPILKEEKRTERKAGHTLIIGKTGMGKTTLAQFLINGLFKYDINILAFDKSQGMSVYTHFVDGEYHDLGDDFKLNPFSLPQTEENMKFLEIWLQGIAGIPIESGISAELAEKKADIRKALERNYSYVKEGFDFKSLHLSLTDEVLKEVFNEYLDGILDHKEDALNFKKQLSVLNMDQLLKDQKLTSIVALYIFQKLISISKQEGKGFFVFIDELRQYLGNEILANELLTLILEARKLNGVVCMGVQNIEFFEEMVGEKTATTFLTNIAHFIIYPTTNTQDLENLEKIIGLTSAEKEFLKTTPISERKVLIKQGFTDDQGIKSSVIADLNLSDLGEYINVFSSSSNDVRNMQQMRVQYGDRWREEYLKQ